MRQGTFAAQVRAALSDVLGPAREYRDFFSWSLPSTGGRTVQLFAHCRDSAPRCELWLADQEDGPAPHLLARLSGPEDISGAVAAVRAILPEHARSAGDTTTDWRASLRGFLMSLL